MVYMNVTKQPVWHLLLTSPK